MKEFNLMLMDKKDDCPLNGNILNYIEDEVISKLLLPHYPKKFENWRYLLGITYSESFKDVFVTGVRQIKCEKTKFTNIFISVSLVKSSPEYCNDTIRAFVELLFQSFVIFFQQNFSKISEIMIMDLYDKLDYEKIEELSKNVDVHPDRFSKPAKAKHKFTIT